MIRSLGYVNPLIHYHVSSSSVVHDSANYTDFRKITILKTRQKALYYTVYQKCAVHSIILYLLSLDC